MELCVVLSVRRFDFEGDSGRVKGVSLTYFTPEIEDEPTRRGVFPVTVNIAEEVAPAFSTLPGLYEVDFRQRPGRNGKPTLTVTGARLREPLTGLLDLVS